MPSAAKLELALLLSQLLTCVYIETEKKLLVRRVVGVAGEMKNKVKLSLNGTSAVALAKHCLSFSIIL